MSTDPYQPPRQENPPPTPAVKNGLPCLSCQSLNTAPDDIFHSKPSIIAIIFFGWVFILIRTAFSSKTSICRDCGEIRKDRTAGAIIALVLLIVFILLLAVSYFGS